METISRSPLDRRSALRLAAVLGAVGTVGAAATTGTLPQAAASTAARQPPGRPARLGPRPVRRSRTTLIGMSAPAGVWHRRVRQVGRGLGARRIYADLADGPDSQLALVEQAHDAGLLPVVSYKVGGDVKGAVSGRYNAVAERAAARLASYQLATAVSFWHEPYGDLGGAEYVAASKQLLPAFRRGRLKVGPILNGWLLDNQEDVFTSYCPDELFGLWDWFGIDTYESGTRSAPGERKPADRVTALSAHLASRGHRAMPIGVAEYNGFTARSIAEMGEVLLSTRNVWFGCVWNSTGGRGLKLSGDRLAAFRDTLADPRCA